MNHVVSVALDCRSQGRAVRPSGCVEAQFSSVMVWVTVRRKFRCICAEQTAVNRGSRPLI